MTPDEALAWLDCHKMEGCGYLQRLTEAETKAHDGATHSLEILRYQTGYLHTEIYYFDENKPDTVTLFAGSDMLVGARGGDWQEV